MVDHLQSQINDRFSEESLTAYSGLYLVPQFLVTSKERDGENVWKDKVKKFANFYKNDFPSYLTLEAELDLWENYWCKIHKEEKPGDIANTLKSVSMTAFPNINIALRILGTIPITSCECERSISALRRLKTWQRSTMGEDRLNGLALLCVHREIKVDVKNVIKRFVSAKQRRKDFT